MTEERAGLPILAFSDLAAMERWLEAQPAGSAGLWIKFAKAGSGIASVSKAEAIDAALCHGWIDGQLDRFDEAYFLVKFTPRRARSRWSQINRDNAERLIACGRMTPRGLEQIEKAKADGRWDAAYASAGRAAVPEDLQAALEADPAARKAFDELDGQNRYAILYRVGDAKKPAMQRSK